MTTTTQEIPTVDTVVSQGADAARRGEPDKANPYELNDSVFFGAWLAGWISGKSEPKN